MKYPNIIVQLTGEDGNAFYILAKVTLALNKNKVSPDEIEKFLKEAKSGNYDNLLVTCMNWVTVE